MAELSHSEDRVRRECHDPTAEERRMSASLRGCPPQSLTPFSLLNHREVGSVACVAGMRKSAQIVTATSSNRPPPTQVKSGLSGGTSPFHHLRALRAKDKHIYMKTAGETNVAKMLGLGKKRERFSVQGSV